MQQNWDLLQEAALEGCLDEKKKERKTRLIGYLDEFE